jgi:opacity protein-like surface antigen
MRKFKAIALTFLLFLFLAPSVFSQPRITFQIYGGYSSPTGDLKGDALLPDTTEVDFQMKNGFNLGADGKVAFGKQGKLRVVLGIGYSRFSNVGAARKSNTDSSYVEINPKLNIILPSIGLEYSFTPNEKNKPYLGIDFTLSTVSGTYYKKNTDGSPKPVPLKSDTRYGIQINGGSEFQISRYLGFNIGIKYHFVNINKKTGTVNDPQNEKEFSDAEHINSYGITVPARTISYVKLYAGLSIFFGNKTNPRK